MNFNFFRFNSKKSVDSILKRNNRTRQFINIEDIATVLVLFSYDEWEEISQIALDLEKRGKHVLLWTVEPKRKKEYSFTLPEKVRVISRKEGYKIVNIIAELNKHSYDTLIDLTSTDDITSLCLLAGNNANFCIGTRELDNKLYDLILLRGDEMSLMDTYKQIITCLASISNK